MIEKVVATIEIPDFFPAQVTAYKVFRSSRRTVIRWGRRGGKTDFAKAIACNCLLKGQYIGWFAPDYKIQMEAYNEIARTLHDVLQTSSKVEGVIRVIPTEGRKVGGRIDFWTLENERAGRSRHYHGIIIDEAAFGKKNVMEIWEQSIEPTLLDHRGWALVLSNTNGVDPDNFFYRICKSEKEKYGFTEFHATSADNPFMPREELVRLEREKHPLIWMQEYLAEFVDFSGDAFFQEKWLLVDGRPIEKPKFCKLVGAVLDTAVKDGKEHDGTAVLYYAVMPDYFDEYRLVILDWELVQIKGALLERWIPDVFARLEELASECKAIYGSVGVDIEDAQSGAILLQQCVMRGYRASPLPAHLTSAGKDGRAINASDAVCRGDVKYSVEAYEKNTKFKETSRNHLQSQINSFRLGDKDAAKRSDDLFDCFCYAIAVTLGDSEGTA